MPQMVSVIPNAVDATVFTPDPSKRTAGRIRVIIVSRLVYRKGIDFLSAIIPAICKKHKNIDFIIGGDGPMRLMLEEVRERHRLMDRVILLGTVEHAKVRDVLVQGDIFLNTSLTEAFCIAIVEAASCGLQVVSTSVGGIPEVLPADLIHLANTSAPDALEKAIKICKSGKAIPPKVLHERVRRLYTWQNVAQRTEKVYDRIVQEDDFNFGERLARYNRQCGFVAGKIMIILATIHYLLLRFIDWLQPASNINRCPDMTLKKKFQEDFTSSYSSLSRLKPSTHKR